MANERILKSRNQREGKFIPGWCYNPNFKPVKRGAVVVGYVTKRRAGGNHTLVKVRDFNDFGHIISGVTYVRYVREGAFQ